MQYHLEGFRPGNPEIKPAAPGRDEGQRPWPDTIDVLIVGSGPAGLTLAAQLAAFPEIDTRIVERRADRRHQTGKPLLSMQEDADGHRRFAERQR